MDLKEKNMLIDEILEKPITSKYMKPDEKRINDGINKRNKIFLYCFELIEQQFRFCKIIEDGSYMAELDNFIKVLWRKAQVYLQNNLYVIESLSSNEINISYEFFDKKIRTYIKTFYAFKETDITIDNKKINFWHLKLSSIEPKELKIYFRDREQALDIWNKMPDKLLARLDKIRLENEELKQEKLKPKVAECRKNKIDDIIGWNEKEIQSINKDLKRAYMMKLVFPLYQNYLFKNYKEYDVNGF